jgi:uncharacterized protein YdaU (DUF1376 family)
MSRKIRRMDFHFDEWLVGTRQMKPAVRGIYIQICALIGSHNEPIEDNASEIATWCACTRDYARRVIDQLVADGKLYRDAIGRLGNKRVDHEISAGSWRIVRAVEAADQRWGKFRSPENRQKLSAHAPSTRGAFHKYQGLTGSIGNANHHMIMNHESSLTSISTDAARDPALNGGSGPRARRTQTTKERVAALAVIARAKLMGSGQ